MLDPKFIYDIVFQESDFNTLHFDGGGVRHVHDLGFALPSEIDIWALVDTDDCEAKRAPLHDILTFYYPNLRVIMATSPRPRMNSGWILRKRGDVYVMRSWSWQELFVVGHFIHNRDLSSPLLREAVKYFGHSPRVCFRAATGEKSYAKAKEDVEVAIDGLRNIPEVLYHIFNSGQDVDGDSSAFKIFEINSVDSSRLFDFARLQPVSYWAVDQMLIRKEARQVGSMAKLFRGLWYHPNFWEIADIMWERGLHFFFKAMAGKKLQLRPLAGTKSEKLSFKGRLDSDTFTDGQDLTNILSSNLPRRSLRYLYPKWEHIPGVNAILRRHGRSLVIFQAVTSAKLSFTMHRVQKLRSWLQSEGQQRLVGDAPWWIVLVFPSTIGRRIQDLQKEIRHDWGGGAKNLQGSHHYLLELDAEEVFGSCR